MNFATTRSRNDILQMIAECSSSTSVKESNSLEYVGVDVNKLYNVLKSRYNINAITLKHYLPSTSIKEIIDFIISLHPKDINASHQQEPQNESFSFTTGSTDKALSYSFSTSYSQSDNSNMEKRKYEYIIGIDLGHGETSAAVCPLQWDTPVEQLDPAKDLEMGGNKKVIPSAITILNNGTAYIGDSAFNPEILKQADVNVCFKKAPENINGEAEKLMIRYMQEVYRRIRENNSAMLTENNHLVYIATPSGWDKATQDLYQQMAKQAGLPIAGLTKESRAAFVRAQHDVTSGIGKYVEKGAVVFDMGSSTLDFTYMNSNRKLIDHGYDCGASFIEKTIFKQSEDKDSVIHRFENKYPKLVPFLLFEARKIKEQVYFDPSLKVKKTINFEDFIDDDDFEDDRFKMIFQPGELNALLERVGYIKELENAARDFIVNHINNAPIYGVFLTGGASRMDFIKSLVSRCWNIPESQIYRDQDPSLTISQGVAEVARMDLRTEDMEKGLEEEINRIKADDEILEFFSMNLIDDLETCVIESIIAVVNAFKDDEEDWTLYGLQTVISQSVEKNAGTVLATAPNLLNNAIKMVTEDIRNKVESIVAHYSNQGVKINAPQLSVSNIDFGDINLDSVIETISKNIEIQNTNWLKYVLMGVGTVFGLVGIGLGYLAGKFLGEKELSEEEKQDKAMSKLLNCSEREQVYNAMSERWEEIVASISDAIEQSINRNSKVQDIIRKATNNILESYKNELKKARILID